ncbi:hypothetical protein AB0N17_17925 [Streptomyces sp. NPDC051133]|uniref:hypothetical protein n=1 Tax=Streptomyces sp. NPDC051133 TaxID=3155521 RepID=UPI00343EEB36
MAAQGQRTLFGGRLDEELRNVEDQVAATGRARRAQGPDATPQDATPDEERPAASH